MVKIDRQTPIIEHTSTTLYQVNFNASKNSISKTENYFDEICKLIVERKKDHDSTLVVTQKTHKETVEKLLGEYGVEGISVAYFGDIIGRNDWRDFTQVWIIANPLYRMETYPLRWSMVSQKPINRHNLSFVSDKGKLRFKNKDFEKIRFGCVVSDIYQAIKRINRDNTRNAEMFVVTADTDVMKELKMQLKGVRMGDVIELNVQYLHKSTKQRKQTQGEKIADFLMRLDPGEYDKATVRNAVGIDKKNFARGLNDTKVKELVIFGRIQIGTRKIKVLGDR